ncbi:MAG: hypothetical protein A2Z08_03185 [Deltaproteobacteria bacterium RBG_16_54_11]|nr:MAG: hypothetical protein A2Z08_03185 [Deltaproteobacteria bacterium RBG_16_54_11]
MAEETTIQEVCAKFIESYCKEKGYQVKTTSEPTKLRLDICNLSDRTIVNIYNTGKIQVQGKDNDLHQEISDLKKRIEAGPQDVQQYGAVTKASSATYDIILADLRERIKESWATVAQTSEMEVSPSKYIAYRTKLSDRRSIVTVTQFTNGKLMLQGKTDYLFDMCCDHLEKTAQPSEKEVAARFVSSDQSVLEDFVARYTPDLVSFSEEEVRTEIGNAYGFLDDHDQKWLVASKCLCNSGIMLPEYSPFVMPSSKAFEGFVKKLMVSIGLVPVNHFFTKAANFSILNDKTNPSRMAVCAKEKYMDTMLEDLRLSLDKFRNFMMHSDSSFVTKVETPGAAKSLVQEVHKTIKEKFDYFGKVFSLSS